MNQAAKIKGWEDRVTYITGVRDNAVVDPDTGLYQPGVQDIIDNFDWYMAEACIWREVAEKCPPTPGHGDGPDTYRQEKAAMIKSRGWHAYWKDKSTADPLDLKAQRHYALLEAEKLKLGWK